MISSQRLMLIIMVIQIMFGVGITIFNNIDGYEDTAFTQQMDIYNEYEKDFKDEEKGWRAVVDGAERILDNTFGDAIIMGKIVGNILVNSLNPFSINTSQFDTTVEKQMALAIMMFRTMLMIIIVWEFYFIFFNKKST